MNTSKSLDFNELLVPLFVQARTEALKELAQVPLNRTAIISSTPTKVDHLVKEAAAAIVEAVEGLAKNAKPSFMFNTNLEGSKNAKLVSNALDKYEAAFLQAIKEWQ